MEAVMFYVLAAITLISAIFVVFLRRPVHNVVFMIVTMIGLAGLFLLLHAEFVAMVQLIVYAGAVMVLFLFVIMLLNLETVNPAQDARAARMWVGALLSLGFLVLMGPVLKMIFPSGPTVGAAAFQPGMSNTEIVARELFTTYLLPFEIVSVLLLAAIIGTVIVSRKRSG
ncbi:MAG: NADH-quinone oxidoreductase subunit J [Desulfomonilaceae bacterium]|nr:NADH-quinone oxidoreductase subunit J [Desulfomonilaceae bacterium]